MPDILRVRTRTLEIGYEAHGDVDGVPVILLHGFPDDARAWDSVAPSLATAGYRVLVPYLRGYGPTHFLESAEPRMAQQAAIGQDLLDFMNALGLPAAGLAGYDWGGRAACIVALIAAERALALGPISGYNVQDTVTAPGAARWRRGAAVASSRGNRAARWPRGRSFHAAGGSRGRGRRTLEGSPLRTSTNAHRGHLHG